MLETIYEQTINKLIKAGIASPRLEARLLISYVLGTVPDEVGVQTIVPDNLLEKLDNCVQKRVDGMPIDKILGHKEFYKYDFIVSKDVLSPRPDTEILLETALRILQLSGGKYVLELGVGSGCVLSSVLKEIVDIQCVGVDISTKALSITRQNMQRLGVENRGNLLCKDWFDDDFVECLNREFDMIVSNPHYIKTGDIQSLDTEVQKYDPLLALDGGEDGLKHYKRIAKIAPTLLCAGGYVLLEIGFGQAADVKQIFEKAGLKHSKTVRDLSGIERVLVFEKC